MEGQKHQYIIPTVPNMADEVGCQLEYEDRRWHAFIPPAKQAGCQHLQVGCHHIHGEKDVTPFKRGVWWITTSNVVHSGHRQLREPVIGMRDCREQTMIRIRTWSQKIRRKLKAQPLPQLLSSCFAFTLMFDLSQK